MRREGRALGQDVHGDCSWLTSGRMSWRTGRGGGVISRRIRCGGLGWTDAKRLRNGVFTPGFPGDDAGTGGIYAGQMLSEGGHDSTREVDADLAVTLKLFEQGGRAALDGIVAQDYDVLRRRPSVFRRQLRQGCWRVLWWGRQATFSVFSRERPAA